MARRYYKKLSPNNNVVLDNNAAVQFKSLDGVTGYFSTEEEYLHAQFAKFMAENRYGLTEISEAEYGEYVKKKQQGASYVAPWREEWSTSKPTQSTEVLARVGGAALQAAVAVNTSGAQATTLSEPAAEAAPQPTPLKLNVGKRKGKRANK